MLDFYRTVGGRALIDGTLPRLVKALEALTAKLPDPAAEPACTYRGALAGCHAAGCPVHSTSHRSDCATQIDHALRCTCQRNADMEAHLAAAPTETEQRAAWWRQLLAKLPDADRVTVEALTLPEWLADCAPEDAMTLEQVALGHGSAVVSHYEHRERLLQNLTEVLVTRGDADVELRGGDVVWEGPVSAAIAGVVSDTYWDERGDWRGASEVFLVRG